MQTLSEQYTIFEEREYLLANNYHTPFFAPGELSKIVNYKQAYLDGYKGWHLHHRLELNPDGTVYRTRDELIKAGLYYQRPATELIFLTDAEHSALHAKSTFSGCTISEQTKSKMSEAKIKANDTENRFRLVQESIDRGDTLCFKDYAFYRRYCLRNGIPFTGCKVDKTSKVSTIDFEKPKIIKKEKPNRFLNQVHRYRGLKAIVESGGAVGRKDAEFIERFCTRNSWEFPPYRIDRDKGVVEIPD